MKLVSIVTPAYDEAATLSLFYEQLRDALEPLRSRARFEFIFVNNGSTDETPSVLTELREQDERIEILTLSRNFGYQAAITAGLRHARGDAIACIDADGEDPPEVLAQFVEAWLDGEGDVIYGVRGRRPESILMQLARKAYYRVTKALADHEIILDMAEFALLDRRVRDAVLATRSTFPFVRGQVGYVGFQRVGIRYDRKRRLGGKSHYNLAGAFKFGLGGILSSSTFSLRLLAYGAALIVPLALAALTALLVTAARGLVPWPLAAVGLGLGLLLVWVIAALAVLAIYLARVYKDQVGLPLYVVDRTKTTLEDDHDDYAERTP